MAIAENTKDSPHNDPSRSLLLRCQNAVSNLLMPPACLMCQIGLPPDRSVQVCKPCQSRITDVDRLPHECPKCSSRLKIEVQQEGCRFCKELANFPFQSVTSLGNYQGLLRDLVIQMKSRRGQNMSLQLGDWLAEATSLKLNSRFEAPESEFRRNKIDFVVPMPSHWLRRMGRGHNVANLLCESFARLPVYRNRVHRCLTVTRRTRKQGTLTMNQRFENIKGSLEFHPKKPLRITSDENGLPNSPNILLLDDVMTSGATATLAARVLKDAGAGDVHLAVVARAIGRIL